MIKSMTGYGRSQDFISGMSITVEIKSVNHRYFEFSSRVPRSYGFLEEKLKSFLQSQIYRGKVECYVQIEALETEDSIIEVNHALVSAYLAALKEISERYTVKNDITVHTLSRYSDILSVRKKPADEENIWNAVKIIAEKAVDMFLAMRKTEGERLKADMLTRAESILEAVSFVEERSPQTVAEYNEKLFMRMKELIGEASVDEQRLVTEAAIFADKVAVAEETVRLRSHIKQLKTMLEADEAVGRKMDFLVQEINREANTIGSKAQDIDIANRVIAIKADVEKIREQVQNIE